MTPTVKDTPRIEIINFESSALHGLRGFVAVHILIFHSLLYSSLGVNTYGQVSTYKSCKMNHTAGPCWSLDRELQIRISYWQ